MITRGQADTYTICKNSQIQIYLNDGKIFKSENDSISVLNKDSRKKEVIPRFDVTYE